MLMGDDRWCLMWWSQMWRQYHIKTSRQWRVKSRLKFGCWSGPKSYRRTVNEKNTSLLYVKRYLFSVILAWRHFESEHIQRAPFQDTYTYSWVMRCRLHLSLVCDLIFTIRRAILLSSQHVTEPVVMCHVLNSMQHQDVIPRQNPSFMTTWRPILRHLDS
jgi:hypothetical protein